MNSPGAQILDRESELAALEEAVQGAVVGRGSMALVEGEAGIGKTELLRAIGEPVSRAGAIALRGAGAELEQSFAFGVARQLFEPLLADGSPGQRRKWLAGAAGLAANIVDPRRLAARADRLEPSAAFHGLYWLTANVAREQPIVLLVDDAHWGDMATLEWLVFLGRRLEGLPVLVVVAARPSEPGAQEAHLSRLRGIDGVRRVMPKPLGNGAVLELARSALGGQVEDRFARACHKVTGGVPLYVAELLRSLADSRELGVGDEIPANHMVGRARITDSVLDRLARLGASTTSVAIAVAILEPHAELQHVAELADVPIKDAAIAVDALISAGILSSADPCQFAHPILRAAVESSVPAGSRGQAHAHAARLLGDGVPLGAVAAHLMRSPPGGDPRTVQTLRAAAAATVSNSAAEGAVSYLTRALAEPPPLDVLPSVLFELGSAECEMAHPDGAQHLLKAFELSSEPRVRADIVAAAAPFMLASGRTTEMLALLDATVMELSASDPDRSLQLEAQFVGGAMIDPKAVHLATARMARSGERLSGRSRGERMMLCYLAYYRTWRSQDAERAADLARRAIANGALIADHGVQPLELTGAITTLVCSDHLAAADSVLAHAGAEAQTRGSSHAYAFVACMRSMLAYRRGAMRETEAEARASLEITLPSRMLIGSAVNSGLLISALLEMGQHHEAEAVLDAIGMANADIPPLAPFNRLLSARGRLRVAAGDLAGGLADLREVGRRNEIFGLQNPVFVPWRAEAAMAHWAIGDVEEARRLADAELAAAQTWGTAGAIGSAERLQALIADGADTVGQLEHAARLLESSPARLEHARCLIELGAALRRANQRRAARQHLEQGRTIVHRLGAQQLAEQARTELEATGARPRALLLTGVDSLTPSERRVADLAATGRTNVEIAQSLFVSVKTVETHLRSAYSKLEITSRRELRNALDSKLSN